MTQAEVINVLKKSKKWLGAKEIAEILGSDNPNTIRFNLYKLFNQEVVLRKTGGESVRKHFIYILK